MTWPTPHPKYVAAGICQYILFRDGSLTLISMASLMVLVMLWSSLPTMLKLSRDNSCPVMLKWSCMGDGTLICSLNLSANVLSDSLCTLYHSPSCHTYICKSLPSSLVCYPCLLGGLGAPWWYWLLRKTFLCHVFCRGFCSFHSILSYRAPLCKVYSSCLSS